MKKESSKYWMPEHDETLPKEKQTKSLRYIAPRLEEMRCQTLTILAAMLLQIFRHPCCLVAGIFFLS